MAPIVRTSKFRHVFGQPNKKDQCYENMRLSMSSFDGELSAANSKFLAVALESGGAGSFMAIPLGQNGRLRTDYPKYVGHRGPITGLAWCPYDDNLLASCAEDGALRLWRVADNGLTEDSDKYETELLGHERKVLFLQWLPGVRDAIASAGSDGQVMLWDISLKKPLWTTKDMGGPITGLSFSRDGSRLAAASKEERVKIFDSRSGKVIWSQMCHESLKPIRVAFASFNSDGLFLITTGFNKKNEREVGLWDTSSATSSPVLMEKIDSGFAPLTPVFDYDTKMLYLYARGDVSTKFFEFDMDDNGNRKLYYLSEYQGKEAIKFACFNSKRACNTKVCEVMRQYRSISPSFVEVVSFIVPRKTDSFQSDIYPDTLDLSVCINASEFICGKSTKLFTTNMNPTGSRTSSISDLSAASETAAGMQQPAADAVKQPHVIRDSPFMQTALPRSNIGASNNLNNTASSSVRAAAAVFNVPAQSKLPASAVQSSTVMMDSMTKKMDSRFGGVANVPITDNNDAFKAEPIQKTVDAKVDDIKPLPRRNSRTSINTSIPTTSVVANETVAKVSVLAAKENIQSNADVGQICARCDKLEQKVTKLESEMEGLKKTLADLTKNYQELQAQLVELVDTLTENN